MSEQLPHRTASHGEDESSPFASLPAYPTDDAGGISELACGECGLTRRGMASYTVVHVLFVIWFVVWRTDEVFKCPSCMRKYLLVRLPLALLMANLLSPLILIWWAGLFFRTFRP